MKLFHWVFKRKILMLGFLAFVLVANAQNSTYITTHKSLAQELAAQYGIPYSVIIAVAIVESSAGAGKVATKLNNHFGIVGSNNLEETTGYKTRYKQYESDTDSFNDFCQLISRKAFYNHLKDNADPKKWVSALSRSGYSGKPKIWEKRILKTITTNRL